jgi:DNA primase
MTTIAEVKGRLDITEIISRYVSLQKAGRHWKALCPFHQERTASFYVFPETQMWRCFGACSTGGDVIEFVQRREELDFSGAFRLLADEAGVVLPEKGAPSQDEKLYAVNQDAAKFYHEHLLSSNGAAARNYLQQRGVTIETIKDFDLGYSPGYGDALIQHLARIGYTNEQMLTVGLLRGKSTKQYDEFRNRVMYPIRDQKARIVGFGARELDGSNPKYLNTSRTAIFDKGATLYGLDRAADTIRRLGIGVIVEGYMDVITAHQHGFTNVVASMGTALTPAQLVSLQRFTGTFILAMDPDSAGQAATLHRIEEATAAFQEFRGMVSAPSARGAQIFSAPEKKFSLRIARLPEGRDPDQLIREDPNEWGILIERAKPFLDYLLEVVALGYDMSTPEGKAQAAERLVPLVYSHVDNFVEQDEYFQRLADLLGVSRQVLQASIGGLGYRRPRRRGKNQSQVAISPFMRSQGDPIEEYCLSLMVQYPDLQIVAENVSADDFGRAENREIFIQCMRCDTMDDVEKAIGPLVAEHLESLLSRDLPPMDIQERERALIGAFVRLRERRLKETKLQESQILDDGDGVIEQQTLHTNEALRTLFLQQRRK